MRARKRTEAFLLLTGAALAGLLLFLLLLPLTSLVLSTSWADVATALRHPQFAPALLLSLKTTAVSLAGVVFSGTSLAWWLARTRSPFAQTVSLLVSLPIVVPPAVLGVALLETFGRRGLLGPALSSIGIVVPFSESAVLLAQTVVSAPFFVQAAAHAFRKVDDDMLLVARTLGASPFEAFVRIALPAAAPGLLVGASLAWARSLGEFGATLLFAGNNPGTTQTMPLAIYSALESDLHLAVVFSLVLVLMAGGLLVLLRLLPGTRSVQDHQVSEFR